MAMQQQPEIGDMSMWEAASVDEVFGFLFPPAPEQEMNPPVSSDPSSFTNDFGGLYAAWQQDTLTPSGFPSQGRTITTEFARTSTGTASLSAISSTGSRNRAHSSEFCSTSSASLPSSSSSGIPGSEGSGTSLPLQMSAPSEGGWQSLLQNLDEQPVVLQPAPAKRGRKPAPGGTNKKPVKDKKRENTLLIRQLEAEMATKLNIVKQLEGQNTELKRKERLLQLSVDTSENNMNRLVDPQLDTNLRDMLQSFRGAYNQTAAAVALSKIAHIKDPKDMNFEVFCSCWQALVMEMCDSLMADATAATPAAKQEAEEHLKKLSTKVVDFVTALCVQNCQVIMMAQFRNLVTGEYMNWDRAFWEGVVDKMGFTEEQIKDLVGAWDMFARCHSRNLAERGVIKEELAAAIANQEQELKVGGHNQCNLTNAVHLASDRLNTNLVRCDTLHTLVSFLALRIMTPRQITQMGMHSSPTFPSLHHILEVVQHKAVAQGLVPPRPGVMGNLAMHNAPLSQNGATVVQ